MKRPQKFISALSLREALGGLSPVVAADAGRTADDMRVQPYQRHFEKHLGFKLSPEQMDNVHAGSISDFDFCLGLCSTPQTINIGPGGCVRDWVTGGCMGV